MTAQGDRAVGVQIVLDRRDHRLHVWSLQNNSIGDKKSAPGLQRMNAHVDFTECLGAGALIEAVSDGVGLGRILEHAQVVRTKIVAENASQVERKDASADKFRAVVLNGEAVPGGVAIDYVKIAIEQEADRGTRFERINNMPEGAGHACRGRRHR